MVSFILGAQRSDREKELYKQLNNNSQTEKILIVPEQISQSVERDINRKTGAKVRVLSFKRLCDLLFKTYGGLAGDYATDKSKFIMMEMTLNDLKDELKVYKKSASCMGFIKQVCECVEGIKRSGFSLEDFNGCINGVYDKRLSDKVNEISKIYSHYSALLLSLYKDPSDNLKRAENILERNNYFEGKEVYFDWFVSFTGSQYSLIEQIIKQADTVFSICCQDGFIYEPSQNTINDIVRICAQNSIKVKKISYLTEETVKNPNPISFFDPKLKAGGNSEENLKVKVVLAQNEYEEADFIASKAIEFTKQGYRFDDMAVLIADFDEYEGVFKTAFDRYDIPFYADCLVCASQTNLFRMLTALLDAAQNLTIDSVIYLLKSDITEFKTRDIAVFENYLYTWDINKKSIKREFKNNPKGFVSKSDETEEDKVNLQISETIRKKVTDAVFCVANANETAEDISNAILKAIDVLGVQNRLTHIIKTADREYADEIKRSWDLFITLIEEIVKSTKGIKLSLKRYAAIFKTAAQKKDVGVVPQGIDTIIVGDIYRTLIFEKKIIFIAGANEGKFPKLPAGSQIFTAYENESLNNGGLKVFQTNEQIIANNRLKIYEALSSASEHLIVSAKSNDASGKSVYPSEIVDNIIRVCKNSAVKSNEIDLLDLCQNEKSAFMYTALHYNENNDSVNALKSYFKQNRKYAHKLNQIEKNIENDRVEIDDKKLLNKLSIGRLSPTQIESFFSCPFNYFCRYTMGVRLIPTAKLDAPSLGSVIHRVLEKVVSNPGFMVMSGDGLKKTIIKELDIFLEDSLGGREGKTARFMQIYYNNVGLLEKLCQNIRDEFKKSQYKPIAFEQIIGGKEIPPLRIDTGKKDVAVIGKIDRIDACEINGKTYIRVVDYKTGKKNIDFGELYFGLNMQMLLYLLAVCSAGKNRKKEIVPAGVLYMPASGALKEYTVKVRGKNNQDEIIKAGFRANGIILDDKDNLAAMERTEGGKAHEFLELRTSKGGEISKSDRDKFLVSAIQMDQLFEFVSDQVKLMYRELKSGLADKDPIVNPKDLKSSCDRCDYYPVCRHIPGFNDKNILNLSKNEFFELNRLVKGIKNG